MLSGSEDEENCSSDGSKSPTGTTSSLPALSPALAMPTSAQYVYRVT